MNTASHATPGLERVQRHLLPVTCTLQDVLVRLNQGVSGVVCLMDDDVMKGLMTDGDVRRGLLSGASMASAASDYMTTEFTSGRDTMPRDAQVALLSDTIRHVPILDRHGRLVDVVTWADIWKMPLVEPSLAGNELKYVTDCVTTNWISSQGSYVTRFEKEFAAYHDMPHAIACSSGTSALHLGLMALGIGHGDEVIIPNLTFGASANAIIHASGSISLVDVERDTWTMDPDRIEAAITDKTKAIMPVHLYGLSCDMSSIAELAHRHSLKIIEDCAESLGATFQDQKTGTFGDLSCFSFFANKTITTGEGGMILTRSEEMACRIRVLRDHGMRPGRRYWHDEVGFNYRMTNMQSAIGCAQLERLDDFLQRRRELVEVYDELSEIPWLIPQAKPSDRESSNWLVSLVLSEEAPIDRTTFMDALANEGIDSRPMFYPLHQQPAYQSFGAGDYPVSTDISYRGVSLPTSNHMQRQDAQEVVSAVKRIAQRNRWLESSSHAKEGNRP